MLVGQCANPGGNAIPGRHVMVLEQAPGTPWILRKEDTEANFKKHIMGWTRRADIYRVIAGDPKLNSKSEKPSCTSDLSSIWAHKPGTAQKSQFSKPKNNMMGWTRRADISWGITGDPKLNTKSEKPSCTLDLGTLVFSTLLKFTTVRAHSAVVGSSLTLHSSKKGACRFS